jgi:hypothetical protein
VFYTTKKIQIKKKTWIYTSRIKTIWKMSKGR